MFGHHFDFDFKCPICLEVAVEPVKNACGHYICLPCVLKVLEYMNSCPLCRQEFDKDFFPVVDMQMQQKIKENLFEEFNERKEELIDEG